MANRTFQLYEGSPLIGSPIIYNVQATNKSGVANLTFHRVCLSVSVGMTGSETRTYPFSIPVPKESTDTEVTFDISSALRAYLDDYAYAVQTEGSVQYPVLNVTVQTWDEYMADGILHTEYDKLTEQVTRHYILGAWTDKERLFSNITKGVSGLSRKPATGEMVPASGIYVGPNSFAYSVNDWFTGTAIATPPTTAVINLASKTANATFTSADGRIVYVDGSQKPYTAFQFVNGFGVLESAFALTFPEESIQKNVKEYEITAPMSFSRIRRNRTRKNRSRHIFKMSSGHVTEAWQRWWQEEFLNTEQAWIWMDSHWLPCSIVPDESVDGIKRTEDDMPEVLFSVKLDIDGI